MRIVLLSVLAVVLMLAQGAAQGGDLPQSPLPAQGAAALHYPKIVLYSTSWCPHCKAAKEYLTGNNIPFINRDVELDDEAMTLLTGKYKSEGVPVIVIGDDEEVMRGFDEARFKGALEKV